MYVVQNTSRQRVADGSSDLTRLGDRALHRLGKGWDTVRKREQWRAGLAQFVTNIYTFPILLDFIAPVAHPT